MKKPPLYRARTLRQNWLKETDTIKNLYGVWYAIGYYNPKKKPLSDEVMHRIGTVEIDYSTLAISFDGMIDKKGNPLFASLDGGNGGSEIKGFYRDTDPLKFNSDTFQGVLRFYSETTMAIIIDTTKNTLRWSDCKQDIEEIGII